MHPVVAARVEDSALLRLFARRGMGFIAGPGMVESEATQQHGLPLVGRTDDVRKAVSLVRARRSRRHPLVAEIEPAGLAKARQTG